MTRRAHRYAAVVILTAGCGQILGVDGYRVSDARPPSGDSDAGKLATREQVTAFLGGGACAECIRNECGTTVDACAAATTCGRTAKCMGECTNPACVVTGCPGAAHPEEPLLLALGDCAKARCVDPCEIGASWGCLKNYDWPPTPTEPFILPFGINVFHSNTPLSGTDVTLCVRGSNCKASNLLASAITDSLGQGEFAVTPWQYLNEHYVPDTSIHWGPTPRTHAHRFEMGAPSVRWADRVGWNALTFETEPHYFLYGAIFDCRGTLMMAAKDTVLVPSWPPMALPLQFYWPDDPLAPAQLNTKTSLSGVFSAIHALASSDAGAPNQLVPPGIYRIEMRDVTTGVVRSYHDVEIVQGENLTVGLFPLTSKQ